MNIKNWFDWFNRLQTNPNFYGQMGHVMGAYGIIMTVALFSVSVMWVIGSWLALIVITVYKEYYYDTHYEIPVQDIKGGNHDFIAYQIGSFAALVICLIKLWLVK